MLTTSVITLRAKSAGFSNLGYTRIESTSADCSARLADYTDTEGVRVVQQRSGIRNLDQDVPWVLTVTFRIGRRPTQSTTGTARPCRPREIVTHARAAVTGIWYLLAPFTSQAHCVGGSSLLSVNWPRPSRSLHSCRKDADGEKGGRGIGYRPL